MNSNYKTVVVSQSADTVLCNWMYHKMELKAFYTWRVKIVSLFQEVANRSIYMRTGLEILLPAFDTIGFYRGLIYHLVTDFNNLANSLFFYTADIANCSLSSQRISQEEREWFSIVRKKYLQRLHLIWS